jgi:hypothetical protein
MHEIYAEGTMPRARAAGSQGLARSAHPDQRVYIVFSCTNFSDGPISGGSLENTAAFFFKGQPAHTALAGKIARPCLTPS